MLSLGRPLTAEEVARGISDNPDADPQTGSVHSYASRLRRALPEDVFPDARSGRYHLDPDKVVVDWTALDTVASEPPDQPGWTDRAIAALELARGEPLGGRVWEGVAPLVRTMQTRIEHIAKTLCTRLIAAGDPSAAEQSVARGLLGFPESIELWGSRLQAATAGSGYGLDRAWGEARGVLKADAALLFPTYQQCKRSLGQEPAPSPDPI
ncbi:MAG TPA: hypothetical protein VFH70_02115 [Acidimicrobiales bacterium]|nr:hypothetical protein [Acidimicrobiales bacterium]